MSRRTRWVLSTLLVALLVGGPLGYASYRQAHFRALRVVEPGVLYRSGQLSLEGLQRVIHDYGIKTVVSLRDAEYPTAPPPDLAEESYCKRQELNFFRIPPRKWWAPDGSAPADEGVRQFLEILDNPAHHPVLVHCFAGIHRTGAHCAIYRMEYQGWTSAEAVAEMKAWGYVNLDDEWDILGYLEQYRPRRLRTDQPSGLAPGR